MPGDKIEESKEIEKLRRENERLRKENEVLRKAKEKIEKEYEQYKVRHPESVGIKHGKPYFIKNSTKKRKGKKAGAGIGHKPSNRKKPIEIDETISYSIKECPYCHNPELSEVQEIRERTVEDIPECKPIVTKCLIERRFCKVCGRLVESKEIPALPRAKIGLRAMLAVTWMKFSLRMTEEAIPKLMWELFKFRISEGGVIRVLDQVAKAFEPYYNELIKEIRGASVRHMDETSWRILGDNAWLWAFLSNATELYIIEKKRDHTIPLGVIGAGATGVNVHDRHSLYRTLSRKTKGTSDQDCWAHILGDSKELSQFYGDEGAFIHRTLKRVHKKALKFHHKGTKADVDDLISDLVQELVRPYKSIRCHRFVMNLLKGKDRLFTFVTNPVVDSTNNRAERGLRHSVIARKISGGSRSEKGARVYGKLTSVVRTLQIRDKNIVSEGPTILSTSHG